MGLGRSNSWEIHSKWLLLGLLGSPLVCYSCKSFIYFHPNPAFFSPSAFRLVEVHIFSQGETTWILKAKYNAPGNMCINSLVFQLVSWTTQHKPSKANTTCVLTASAWWKAGILGKIISQKEELTWYDQEFGALPENELVTPNSRVHTEFPFFAKTPQMLRKSNHSQHRSSADKSSGCNNNQMTGKREGLSQRLAMRGWGDHPWVLQTPGWISEVN